MRWNSERWTKVFVPFVECAVHAAALISLIQVFWAVAQGAPIANRMPVHLVIMVSGLAVTLAALAARVWITLPRRTASDFLRLLREGRFEELVVHRLMSGEAGLLVKRHSKRELWLLEESSLIEEARSPLDILFGRLRFRIAALPYDFTVNRGRVQECVVKQPISPVQCTQR